METLRQLMSAYFHQDWSDEYGGTWQVAHRAFPEKIVRPRAALAVSKVPAGAFGTGMASW